VSYHVLDNAVAARRAERHHHQLIECSEPLHRVNTLQIQMDSTSSTSRKDQATHIVIDNSVVEIDGLCVLPSSETGISIQKNSATEGLRLRLLEDFIYIENIEDETRLSQCDASVGASIELGGKEYMLVRLESK
jgi:hypothetical protein